MAECGGGGGGGGLQTILCFGCFLKMESISEHTVNRALIVHTTLQNLKKKSLASCLCGKKEGGGAFFFLLQNGRRTHFPKQPAGLFFSRWLPDNVTIFTANEKVDAGV